MDYRCEKGRKIGNRFSDGVSFNHPFPRGTQGTSWFQSSCGCRRAGRSLPHSWHIPAIPWTTSAHCLLEIGGVLSPTSCCRVSQVSCCKAEVGASARAMETHFCFMVGSWESTDFLNQAVTNFSAAPMICLRGLVVFIRWPHSQLLPSTEPLGGCECCMLGKQGPGNVVMAPEATKGPTARKSSVWVSDRRRLSYLPDHSLALWYARLLWFFRKHRDKVYSGKQRVQSPDWGSAAVSFHKNRLYRGN